MSKLKFTPEEIKAYWDTTPKIPVYLNNRYSIPEEEIMYPKKYDTLHPYYVDSLMKCEAMRVHADGFFPYKLLSQRRPNEPLEVMIYRELIWVAKTKPVFSKVFNSLAKIRRSADWMIQYPENKDEFTSINDNETLEAYCEQDLPYFKSLTDWAFTALLRKYLIDPNGVVFVTPMETDIPQNSTIQPYPVLYDSLNVMDYVDDDYAVLLNPYGSTYYESDIQHVGKSMYIITTMYVDRYDQANGRMDYNLTRYNHNLNWLPVFKLGGTLVEQTDNHFLYESRIAGMIPELDEAVRENSDLQAVKVLHQFPERWEITNKECKQCHGVGRLMNSNWTQDCNCPDSFLCDACDGQGVVATGPFSKMLLKTGDATSAGQQLPIPPAGFIEKDVEIIKIQELSVKQHIYDALSSINFEFLADAPLVQSGVSKQYDRNESNNTSHAVAEDIVAILDSVYKTIAYYRYLPLYPADKIDEMLPTIPVPENYDLYSIADSQTALNDAKTGKTNPVIINAMEQDFANKLFSADPKVKDRLSLILTLDPLPNITEDEKMSRLSNKGITQVNYVISSNIQQFVQQAMEDDPDFQDKQLSEQKTVMETMAKAVIDENNATAKIIQMATPDVTGLNADGSMHGNSLNIRPVPIAPVQ